MTSFGNTIVTDETGDINPTLAQGDIHGRRTLLLVYIHGFMGDESSFRNFPAHVHSLLTVLVQDTHIVYSKIYPRYRSKKFISVARDDFSNWIQPHTSETTDVVLLGHSMGGLVSAEVALIPGDVGQGAFKHRVLGTINFDVPFLGMHPGVISSGLASIFVPAGEAPTDRYVLEGQEIQPSGTSNNTFWQPPEGDQTFNAKFNNDVVLPVRKFWQSVQHFVHKHGSDLSTATSKLVSSHIEFMSAMGNAEELRSRYTKLRVLEEDNETMRRSIASSNSYTPRVRFVNYYTVSSGRPKPQKPAESDAQPTKDDANAPSDSEARMLEASTALDQSVTSPTKDNDTTSPLPGGQITMSTEVSKDTLDQAKNLKAKQPQKDRKFCNLPPKDSHGERDPAWVRIFMADVDEVGAHCGMFFVDERYERLVADVAERIETWINEDLSSRFVEISSTQRQGHGWLPDEKRR